jgi:hypothetical protein
MSGCKAHITVQGTCVVLFVPTAGICFRGSLSCHIWDKSLGAR